MKIPQGWRLGSLKEITKQTISYGIVQAGEHIVDGVPYIKSSDVGGEIKLSLLQRTNPQIHYKYRRSAVHPNDIVFSLRGNIGELSIVPESITEANLTQGTARISVHDKNDTKYVYYQMSGVPFRNKVHSLSKGSTFREISLQSLREIQILLPPLPEQKKIAEILETWDAAITAQQKLIAAGETQKKALMQQLLTGKKRLKGYSGKTSNVSLTDTCQIQTGNSNREDSSESGEYTFFDRSTDIRRSNRFLFDCEAIVIGGEGQDFIPKYFIGKFDLHQRAYALSSYKNAYGKYIYYAIYFHRRLLKKFSVGSTVASLRMGTFKKMMIWLPPIEEQTAIAAILSNTDREIELQQRKLACLKQEKTALMQQLLTGKRRVKIPPPKEAAA